MFCMSLQNSGRLRTSSGEKVKLLQLQTCYGHIYTILSAALLPLLFPLQPLVSKQHVVAPPLIQGQSFRFSLHSGLPGEDNRRGCASGGPSCQMV